VKRVGDRATGRHGDGGRTHGVTLIEMLIVVALIGLLVGIVFPPVSAGLETLRLTSAGNSVVSFLNGALSRAERRQEAIEITIDTRENLLVAASTTPGFERRLEMPDGVRIVSVQPPLANDTGDARIFFVYPGGTVPRIGVELVNRKGARRMVQIDPIMGVPEIERSAAQ
jgi:prepilin-type N-terminal cleavage/methylation domain-containing protein